MTNQDLARLIIRKVLEGTSHDLRFRIGLIELEDQITKLIDIQTKNAP
jgi:hypothetical protein